MEKRIVIAYANKNTNYKWIHFATSNTLDSAKKSSRILSETSMSGSAIAIFIDNADGVHFSEKKYRYLYNRHVLAENINLNEKFNGLINSLESDYF
jgi:hypothetical protein